MRAPGPMRVGAADLQAGKGWRSWRRMLLAPVRARCAQASRGGPKRGCAFVTGPRHIVAALPSPPISAPHGWPPSRTFSDRSGAGRSKSRVTWTRVLLPANAATRTPAPRQL